MWIFPVEGTVLARSGSGAVDEGGSVEGGLILDATSLATGNKKRDAHLQTDEFFGTSRYPTFDFTLTGARMISPKRAAITGTLAIRGRANPVSFEADVAADPATVVLSGEIDDIDRTRWDISWAKMGAGIHNKIGFSATFTKA
jgi:polyisoprenoid-binding protein YceI